MDFADERFVRIYTRDSKTWLRWGWEGQTVFVLTMRKFDQTGRIDDVDDLVEDIALLTGLPPTVVGMGLPRILASGTFVHRGRAVECPNFIDGQTASKSDSARCREYRARLKARRDTARSLATDTECVATNTECVATDTKRPGSTASDTRSGIPSHPIPNDISSDSPSAADAHEAPSESEPKSTATTKTTQAVKCVFDCWQAEHAKQRSKLDAKRSARIRARLGEGFTVEQLCAALRGAKKDPFLMGRDPRAGRAFDGLETLLRDAAQVERLIALEEGAANHRAPAPDEGQWLT